MTGPAVSHLRCITPSEEKMELMLRRSLLHDHGPAAPSEPLLRAVKAGPHSPPRRRVKAKSPSPHCSPLRKHDVQIGHRIKEEPQSPPSRRVEERQSPPPRHAGGVPPPAIAAKVRERIL